MAGLSSCAPKLLKPAPPCLPADRAAFFFCVWTQDALATLNVAHQWNTWTRRVANHSRSAGTFDFHADRAIERAADETR